MAMFGKSSQGAHARGRSRATETVSRGTPPKQQGIQNVPDAFPAEDLGAANETISSYADLAGRADNTNKLGPVVISLRNVTKIYPAQPDKPALAGLTLDNYSVQ